LQVDIPVFSARAAVSAYIVLAGFWLLISFMIFLLDLRRHPPGTDWGAIVPLGVGALWIVWLRGFRLEVSQGDLSYRDGLYRSTMVPLSDIREAKNTWIGWKLLTRKLQVPRLVVTYGSKSDRLAINAKPFRRQDIQRVIEILKPRGTHMPRGAASRGHS
jgi:hypothetical protein